MFIPPSATTRPTKPDTTEKRRSLSRESLRRSSTAIPESLPDSDEYSSISDLSECSNEAEHRERTRTSSGSYTRTRKPITRSTSSRLPVSAKKPTVMKRAHSFTRGTDSCVPRGKTQIPSGSTNAQQESSSTSDLSSQQRSSTGTSKIPRKTGPRAAGSQIPQSSRIPLKRADVNSNLASREKSGKETSASKRAAPPDAKASGIPRNTSSKQTLSQSKESREPAIPKQSSVSSIPVKSGNKSALISKIPSPKLDSKDARSSVASNTTEQNQSTDKENEDAMQGEKSTMKREETGDELRNEKNDVVKSKLPRKSNIPKSNITKALQQKTRNNLNPESETSQITTNNTTTITDSKMTLSGARREQCGGSAGISSTSNTLQRSDSGYGDTDSVSSKEDAPVAETGNEFTLSRENSKSKIPIMSWKGRSVAKSSRDGATADEEKPKADAKKTEGTVVDDASELLNTSREKREKNGNVSEADIKTSTRINKGNTICPEIDDLQIHYHETSHVTPEHDIPGKVENTSNETNIDNDETSSKGNLVQGLETNNDVMLKTVSRDVENESVEPNAGGGREISNKSGPFNGNVVVDTSSRKELVKNEVNGSEKKRIEKESIPSSVKLMASSDGHEEISNDFQEKKNTNENNNVAIKLKEGGVNEQGVHSKLSQRQSTETSKCPDGNAERKITLQKDVNTSKLENGQEPLARKLKQSPRKPPRLSKLLVQNDSENKQEDSSGVMEAPRNVGSNEEGNLNKDISLVADVVNKSAGDGKVGVTEGVNTPQDLKEVGAVDVCRVPVAVGDMVGKTEGTGQPREVVESDPSHLVEVGDEEKEEPPRRSDNCMQCRMEESMLGDEEISDIKDDPGFRQYPTFISPRKSLVMCKHHAKQKNDTDITSEQPLVPMKTLDHKPELTTKILNLSESNKNDTNIVGIKSPIRDRLLSPVLNNHETLGNTSRTGLNKPSEGESKTLPGPKGSHSPLLALSRDKKFAQNSKPNENIKTALSLEWDDTGTELSPPNFSDDEEDIEGTSGDLEDTRRPSVKLMNTNEALDKLKVIQSLIMKEAENRGRKESEESAEKYSVGTKNSENEGGSLSRKYDSTSNQGSPTLENPARKTSSPTIWDRITDNSTISQDQTTELLNETLAKLKASPKLSGNALAKRSLSSRSLPGSRQASKEQLVSDGERPVYVYTSNWMNTSGKNSRGSSLSLYSNNRSLPSSRQNLTKELGLKRSESAAGRMEKENGKRYEPKERKEYRLSDFDEVNLSDDLNELKNQKASTPHQTPQGNKTSDGGKMKKSKRSKKKSKNTAATMNNLPSYGVSMDDLADGKTQCQCGGNKCVIS